LLVDEDEEEGLFLKMTTLPKLASLTEKENFSVAKSFGTKAFVLNPTPKSPIL